MALTYSRVFELSTAVTTANTVLVGPIDIKNFDAFSIIYQNNDTAAGFIELIAQVAVDPSETAADTPPNWVALSTATLEAPSALGATSVAVSSRVDNAWAHLRFLGAVCQTAINTTLKISVTGFNRF